MQKGMSIHIGLNRLDPEHYGSRVEALDTCEQDAIDLQKLALAQDFKSSVLLLSETATRSAVKSAIRMASQELVDGDLLLLSYSGHGGFVFDTSGDEEDRLDETWCLYDAQLIDDELNVLWTEFKEGVRIVILSDSCHSGTVAKANMFSNTKEKESPIFKKKLLSYSVAKEVYLAHKDFYREVETSILSSDTKEIKASIKQISACQDPQVSYAIPFANNSIFTEQLLKLWDNGKYVGNYATFFETLKNTVESLDFLPTIQTPNLYLLGKENPDFDMQKPFQIDEQ
ncbi:MAG: hypothetical protein KU29_07515 [Sulfurovum sp. FS06-10]|nr:MAG: hypothetical protein KU29_07515 [Sulfurovum sp. FS06-10]